MSKNKQLFQVGRFSYVDVNSNINVSNVTSLSSLLTSTPFSPSLLGSNVIIPPCTIPVLDKKRLYNLKVEHIPLHQLDILTLNKPHKNVSTKDAIANATSTVVDLRSKFPPVFDQGQLGSCTANALCGIVGYDLPGFIGSRLFVYYNERKLEQDIPDDNGAQLSDGVKTLKKCGVCSEMDWPYDISKFTQAPPKTAYINALKNKALKVKNINNDITSMKKALNHGYPFVVGITIYESFESESVAKTGIVTMPTPDENSLGGHAVVCVGYDDTKNLWIMRNSWGEGWGDGGYFYLPYEYLTNSDLASDLWCVTSML